MCYEIDKDKRGRITKMKGMYRLAISKNNVGQLPQFSINVHIFSKTKNKRAKFILLRSFYLHNEKLTDVS